MRIGLANGLSRKRIDIQLQLLTVRMTKQMHTYDLLCDSTIEMSTYCVQYKRAGGAGETLRVQLGASHGIASCERDFQT